MENESQAPLENLLDELPAKVLNCAARAVATIGDIHLTGALKRMRESIRPGSRDMLAPAQGFGLSKVKTPKDAVKHLLLSAILVVEQMPEQDIDTDHPAIGALATVLAHPDADANLLRFLDARRAKVEEAVRTRDAEWTPAKLEWNWALVVAAHPEIPLHPGLPLPEHVFRPEEVGTAWLALVDLEVLWAWGLVS